MLSWGVILLGTVAWLGAAQPIQPDASPQWTLRERRSPMAARTMILIRGQPTGGGYHYERPERTFNPHAAMAAYATGGTVAAGSFYGSPSKKQICGKCNELVDEQPDAPKPEEEKSTPETPQEEEAPTEVDDSKGTPAPERKPKASKAPKTPKAPKRRPNEDEEDDDGDEDDDDDGEESVPRKGGRPVGSVYRNFFPMSFGGASRSKQRDASDGEGEGSQGAVTAIANSFSKGRGAIASSSAVAHGNPDASQFKQSQPSRYRARA